MKNHETRLIGYAPFLEVNATISLIHIFMVIVVTLVVVVVVLVIMFIKEISNRHFITRNRTIM